MFSLLDSISMGAAAGAVAAVAYLAYAQGIHAQKLIDHERRITALERHYDTIAAQLSEITMLIKG